MSQFEDTACKWLLAILLMLLCYIVAVVDVIIM